MITTTCLILWMPELPLDVGTGSGAPAPTVSATRATTPARPVTRVGITRSILPTRARGTSAPCQSCAKSARRRVMARGPYRPPMLITHLGLTVRDPDRSRRFYLEVLGLDGTAYPELWGFRLDLRDGFILALIRGEPAGAELARTVHFGAALSSAGAAREVRDCLRGRGVPEVEWEDSDDYVGAKVSDPDGYVVELAYEPRPAVAGGAMAAGTPNAPPPKNGDEALAR